MHLFSIRLQIRFVATLCFVVDRLSSFCNFFLIVNLIVYHMDLLQIVAFVNYLLQIAVSIKQLQQSH